METASLELTLDQALQKGIEAHKAGNVQEADQYYTAILKANPNHPDANHNIGVLAVGVGKVQEALPFFRAALEANPNIEQFWLSYIDALVKCSRFEDAKSALNKAKPKGFQSKAMNELVKSFGQLIEREKASLSRQDPSQSKQQYLINLYNTGQLEKVLAEVEKLLLQFPKSIFLYNIKGASYGDIGSIDKAIECFKEGLSIAPDHAEIHNNMGNMLKCQGKFDEALEAFKKAF